MKYYTFYRENNNFEDILTDSSIMKKVDTKIRWNNYLMIGISSDNDLFKSLLTLKYGDEMVSLPVVDFTPIPNVDYVPKKDIDLYKKYE